MEDLLNEIVSDQDRFAFRDNVPCGYLMLHRGEICDVSSWDRLQFTYNRNTPAILFDYYKRKGSIPDVIIYVDYGRDPLLSIESPGFRYNDFVNAYYHLDKEISLEGVFRRVLVYRYSGGFDGDIDRWIQAYNFIPSQDITGSSSAGS